MKNIIAFIIWFLFFLVVGLAFVISVQAADTCLTPGVYIEAGMTLPSTTECPYCNCITYNSHNTITMQLTFASCPNHSDGAQYFPVIGQASYFSFNGVFLYFKFSGWENTLAQLWYHP